MFSLGDHVVLSLQTLKKSTDHSGICFSLFIFYPTYVTVRCSRSETLQSPTDSFLGQRQRWLCRLRSVKEPHTWFSLAVNFMDNFWCGYRFIPPPLSLAAAGNYSLARFPLPPLVRSVCLCPPRPLVQSKQTLKSRGWILAQPLHCRAGSDLWPVVRGTRLHLSQVQRLRYVKKEITFKILKSQ